MPGVFLAYSTQPTSYTGVVAMVAAKGDGVIVLDTGVGDYMPGALLPALAALRADVTEITAICSTHGHFDHSGGSPILKKLSGAPMYLSAADAGLASFSPDVLLKEGDKLDIGRFVFDVLATPGHTAGSVCFYEPSHRLLVAGDAVQGSGSAGNGLLPVYFDSGRDYRSGLRRLLDLPIETLVMGHPLEWSGIASCVHRGATCQALLTESLDASALIASAVATVRQDAGGRDLLLLRRMIFSELRGHPLFERFDPDGVIGESTNATLRSEFRDLGMEVQ
jgi:glyoxylase-like metal-dependent hydrolase (beta-lactamase superfamily II)